MDLAVSRAFALPEGKAVLMGGQGYANLKPPDVRCRIA